MLERSTGDVQRAADEIVDLVREARIIGLGEPTHGEGMTQRLHNTIVQRAVTQLGCTSVVIEGRFSDVTSDDAWVRAAGPDRAVSGADYVRGTGTRGTHEWAELFDQLRTLNERKNVELRISGTDPCVTAALCMRAMAEVIEPFSQSDATRLRGWAERDDAASRASVKKWSIPGTLPEHERATLARLQQLVREGELQDMDSPAWDQRERIMADNVEWAERRSPGCVLVLAHAAHTDMQALTRPDRPWWKIVHPMGHHLRERYKDGYQAVHFTLGRGRFLAHRTTLGFVRPSHLRRAPPLRAFELTDVVGGSVELLLADRREITVLKTAELGAAAMRPMFMRDIPFIWNGIGKLAKADWGQRTPSAAFDVLVYTPRGVPMIPLPNSR